MSDPREPAREQAEEAYHGFLSYMKYFSFLALAGIVFVGSCNFGVDGTGAGNFSGTVSGLRFVAAENPLAGANTGASIDTAGYVVASSSSGNPVFLAYTTGTTLETINLKSDGSGVFSSNISAGGSVTATGKISAGANILAAEKFIENVKPKGDVVTFLCDRGDRYFSCL